MAGPERLWLSAPRPWPLGTLHLFGRRRDHEMEPPEFVGIIRDECIPDWAAEKLAELQHGMHEMTL